MANEVILTATTAAYLLDASDNLYVGINGSIVYTGAANGAIGLRTQAEETLDIVIDGQVVSVGNHGIYLTSALRSNSAGDTIINGSTGLARSVSDDGIHLERSNEAVINHGAILGMSAGMGVFGNDFNLTNTGTVSGVYAGLQLSGSNTSVNNSGTISGTIAV